MVGRERRWDIAYHSRQNIRQRPRNLKHNNHNRNANMHNPTQRRRRPQKRIRPRRDTRPIRLTCIKERRVGKRFVSMLDQDADHAPKRRADSHRRDEDACGHFAAKGDDDEECAYDGRDGEGSNHVPALVAIAELVIVVAHFAFLEQNLHALGHVDPQEHVRVADDSRGDRERDGFRDGVVCQVLFAEDLHFEIPLYDESAVEAAEDADEEVGQDLKEVPAAVVFDLEHDELPGAEGVHCLCRSYQYSHNQCTR